MSNELALVEKQKKEIQGFIETVVMNEPSLKDKLTAVVAWNYLQMPDATFGWSSNGAMPQQMKLMAIAAHLQVGAKIGYGHIYFLGSKLYQSADFVRSQAASNEAWKICGEAKFVPHTEAERQAYGLTDKDMSIKCVMDIEFKGKIFRAEGDGIIGADEINYRSQNGKPKAGMDNIKNRAMTLKTRAQRDLYNRFYPTNGIPVAPEHGDDNDEFNDKNYTTQLKVMDNYSTPETRQEVRQQVQEAVIIDSNKDERKRLDDLLEKIKETAKPKGIKLGQLWDSCGCKTQADLKAKSNQDYADCLEVMSDFVDGFKVVETAQQTQPTQEQLSPIAAAAMKAYQSNIKVVEGMGGLPTRILGFNHLNVLEYTDAKMIQEQSKKLESFIAEKGKQIAQQQTTSQAPQVEQVPPPSEEDDLFADFADAIEETKKTDSDKESLDTVNSLLNHATVKVKADIVAKLNVLKGKILKYGDHVLITQATRIAVKMNNLKELDDLISSR